MGIKKKHVQGCKCCAAVNPGCGCADQPTSWTVTITGMTDDLCTDCNESTNGTFSLSFVSSCLWRYTLSPFCGGVATAKLELLITDLVGSFRVDVFWTLAGGFGAGVYTWQKTVAGSNCMLSATDVPWLSESEDPLSNFCTAGAGTTCTVTAVP